jgi:hypothetical protein
MACVVWALCGWGGVRADAAGTNWAWLDNGVLRVGLNRESGGAIGWISASGSPSNLVDHWDRGRLVQQSYYGGSDGSFWAKRPWNWNPVQGGDWRGRPARLTREQRGSNWIETTTIPRHWGTGDELAECRMDQRVELDAAMLRVRFRFAYDGTNVHPVRDQEVPAVFVTRELSTLVTYDGESPWTGGALRRMQPGFPNEPARMTEHWAAWVGADGRGLGVCVPVATNLTAYRVSEPGKPGACSYVAPLTRFAITPGMRWEYEAAFSVGTVETVRERFGEWLRARGGGNGVDVRAGGGTVSGP